MVVGVGVGSCSGFLRCSYKTHKRPTPKPDNPVHRHPKAGVTQKKHVGYKGVVGAPAVVRRQRWPICGVYPKTGSAAPNHWWGGEDVVGRSVVGFVNDGGSQEGTSPESTHD